MPLRAAADTLRRTARSRTLWSTWAHGRVLKMRCLRCDANAATAAAAAKCAPASRSGTRHSRASRELPGPRRGCNGRQGAMGDAGGRREGPRTTPGPKGRFAASSGRRPVPRGLPRAALTFRVPGAARPRRAPRAASRSARQPGLTHPVSSETTLYTNLPLSLFFMPQRTPSFSAEPRFGVQHGLPPCLCDYFLPPSHYFLRLAPFVCV